MFLVEDLTYKVGGRSIFDSVDFLLEESRITAVFGPSGSGKTTLLYLLAGLIRPQSGKIKFKGVDLATARRDEMDEILKSFGFLLQSGGLFTHLTVAENIGFPIRFHMNMPEKFVDELCRLKADSVGLKGSEGLYPQSLSGGMCKRAALARAMALDPKVLILDEPFVGQDPCTIKDISNLIKGMQESLGVTVLIVSHDLPETVSIIDYAYFMSNDGKLSRRMDKSSLIAQRVGSLSY